jgi:beta-glucosidase
MSERQTTFPKDFLWGTSTSGYQIEGGGENTDWYRYETKSDTIAAEPCGDACDSWNRYEEDLDIIESLGLNSFRLSLEWAKIEPQQGVFSQEVIAHYKDVLEACHARGIQTVVTLHHFTLPLWVADLDGFENPKISEWMGKYADVVARELGNHIDIACTINEPNIVALMGYLLGVFPPQVRDRDRYNKVNEAMRACHVTVRDALRKGPGTYPIGLCLSMQEYECVEGGEETMDIIRTSMEDEYLAVVGDDDFIGVQCYTKVELGPNGIIPATGEITEMGYAFWPECVEYTVRRAASVTGIPVVVTENGIGTNDDEQRIRYLNGALQGLVKVIDEGLDVRGYFQWSLLDNFEWTLGYRPKFGIVEVDRTSFKRTLKPSAQWYSDAAKKFPESFK